MSEGEDLFDREGAYYAAILTPLVFLQQYRDTWCLLERVTNRNHNCSDLFDRKGPYYAAILSPLVFLQQYRDAWCLLERVT
ncbi:putative regulator of cell autolysis [Operophtera brumata]|uniref:Putative regulator of cell autolysis n=1 Tax=Operophtera brumata TaxID=104452 RepID=A0A0L7KKT6_OPEBR|nr:putative regulator of cell autolysis [Operophtera brumata]